MSDGVTSGHEIIVVTKCKDDLSAEEKQQDHTADKTTESPSSVFFTGIRYREPYHMHFKI